MLQEPDTNLAWERYFDLRWRLLRAPWRRPRGTEKDEHEDHAFHLMWCVRPNLPIGVGRMHLCGPGEAQIRFMGVLDCWRNSGIGTSLVEALEAEARKRGAIRMVLNARIDASGFYESLGYQIEGPGPLLFGEIPHVRMTRDLTRAVSSPKPKPVLTV